MNHRPPPSRPSRPPKASPGTQGRPARQGGSGGPGGAGHPGRSAPPLSDAELDELDALLAQVPAPLQALDLSGLDGFLAGVLLQPRRIPAARWLPLATDENGRPWPATWAPGRRLQQLIGQRHAELDALIEARQWFDPWITDVEEDTPPTQAVQAWVLGFATACGEFAELTEGPGSDSPELIEALAQLYQHLDPADLEDADALLAEIESLEPPASMEEAVESLVRGCLLMADLSRPVARQGVPGHPRTRRSRPGGPGGQPPR